MYDQGSCETQVRGWWSTLAVENPPILSLLKGDIYTQGIATIYLAFFWSWLLGYPGTISSRAEHRRKTSFPYDTIATVSWSHTFLNLGTTELFPTFFFSGNVLPEMIGTFIRKYDVFFVGGKKYNRVSTKTKNKPRTATMLLDLCQLTWLETCLSLIWEMREDKLAWHW